MILSNDLNRLDRNQRVRSRIFYNAVYQNWKREYAKKHGKSYGTPTIMAATTLEALTKMNQYIIQE